MPPFWNKTILVLSFWLRGVYIKTPFPPHTSERTLNTIYKSTFKSSVTTSTFLMIHSGLKRCCCGLGKAFSVLDRCYLTLVPVWQMLSDSGTFVTDAIWLWYLSLTRAGLCKHHLCHPSLSAALSTLNYNPNWSRSWCCSRHFSYAPFLFQLMFSLLLNQIPADSGWWAALVLRSVCSSLSSCSFIHFIGG